MSSISLRNLGTPGAALAAWLLTLAAAAQEPRTRPAEQLPANPRPSFFVRLDVNHETRSYREGDGLVLTAVSEQDCYAYIIYHQADGQSFQVFPNRHQSVHRLKARQAVRIPAEEDLFRWRVAPPFGAERITLLCTQEPIDLLDAAELRAKRFNPVSREQLKGVALEIGKERPSAWAIDEAQIHTYPASQQLREGKRRVGVFFGVANYQFHVEAEAAGGSLNLATCHRDARVLRDLMRETGELEEAKVYTNEQATRANLEQAVTQWLPSITRPGDTVFIYFSGHGGQTPDESGDEPDGQDEFLLPHDFVSAGVAAELLTRLANGSLDPQRQPLAEALGDVVAQAGSADAAARLLTHQTGVSDDLFAHWLQRLAGREVVVILDVCHAGGFAAGDQGDKGFDFAAGEASRLKDLGQRQIALLSACGSHEAARVRDENDLSVMTYYLAEAIRSAPAQLSLERAFDQCRVGMTDYFHKLAMEANSAGQTPPAGHVPQLFGESAAKVWLKP
jgi:hypothetical protein